MTSKSSTKSKESAKKRKSSASNEQPKKKKSDQPSTNSGKKQSTSTKPTPVASGSKQKYLLSDLFGVDEDAHIIQEAKQKQKLESVLWRRVANGLLKRSEDLEGNLFIELRVYNKSDIINVDARNRYWKAAVNLRYQVNDSEPELEALYKFIKLVKAKFTSEGSFCMEKPQKE